MDCGADAAVLGESRANCVCWLEFLRCVSSSDAGNDFSSASLVHDILINVPAEMMQPGVAGLTTDPGAFALLGNSREMVNAMLPAPQAKDRAKPWHLVRLL